MYDLFEVGNIFGHFSWLDTSVRPVSKTIPSISIILLIHDCLIGLGGIHATLFLDFNLKI